MLGRFGCRERIGEASHHRVRELACTGLPIGLDRGTREAFRRYPEAGPVAGASPHARRGRLDGQGNIEVNEGQRHRLFAGAIRTFRKPGLATIDGGDADRADDMILRA
jgi:hypothetical protein